jgi:cardiolipin synthase
MLHCKMLFFDHYTVSVGWTNFDMRSIELNDEASLNIYDAKFAQRMTEVFEDDLKSSSPHDFQRWQQRPWQEKFR